MTAEFDRLAEQYDELLKDPLRDYFAPGSGFFVARKLEVMLGFARAAGIDTRRAAWLDVGCGQGELLRAGRSHFGRVVGCDVSAGMIAACPDLEVVAQTDARRLPFADASMDWITAVCVYHHVERPDRATLTADIQRVLKPGGVFAIIEHNPVNPVVQLIVRRTPVDEHAILLMAPSARRLMRDAGLQVGATRYFLYVPQPLYRWGRFVERALERVPLGGQYAVFGRKAS
jgi:SAM-dependent methyltransferase